MLRGDPHCRHDLDQFRDFLGHELRSPLTAIKTALAVLAASKNRDPDSVRMLQIAERNLTRLTGTVEWSQELLSLSEAQPAAELGPVSLTSLAAAIPEHLEVKLDEENEDFEVLTDPRLLAMLAAQMERVLAYACPGSRPSFRLDLDSSTGDCRLTASAVADPHQPSVSRISHTGGVEAGLDSTEWNGAELHHLIRMLVSPHLLQVLGVRPRLNSPDPALVELNLDLQRWTPKPSFLPEDSLSV